MTTERPLKLGRYAARREPKQGEPMTTMLEKMARAICLEYHNGCGFPPDLAHEETNDLWEDWLGEARAALQAIREPDLKMRQAATTFTGADIDWPAMIDAILAGEA